MVQSARFAMSGRCGGPRIGVSLPSRAGPAAERAREKRNTAAYLRALRLAGGEPVELRPEGEADLTGLEALLLTGGGDMEPRRYGQPSHPSAARVDPARDGFELRMAREALARQMPVLGICRGAQVLGVVSGGELIQDIPSQCPGAVDHAPPAGGPVVRHWVRVAEGSRLREMLGAGRVCVNSYHHQANGRLGAGMRAVAWCEDGVMEAVEGAGPGFVLGVQWHPERMLRAPRQRRLFAALVAAAS